MKQQRKTRIERQKHPRLTAVGLHCGLCCLPILLHKANKLKDKRLYPIKDEILAKYGTIIGEDIQFIEGIECCACNGSGIYEYDDGTTDLCWFCINGWYRSPFWVKLQKIQFGKYTFHKPIERVYGKPENKKITVQGYIRHTPTKFSKVALVILLLIYRKGYIQELFDKAKMKIIRIFWRIRDRYTIILHRTEHVRRNRKESSLDDLPF